ncbi:unnamed protein product [Sphacelaria rigidula]
MATHIHTHSSYWYNRNRNDRRINPHFSRPSLGTDTVVVSQAMQCAAARLVPYRTQQTHVRVSSAVATVPVHRILQRSQSVAGTTSMKRYEQSIQPAGTTPCYFIVVTLPAKSTVPYYLCLVLRS